MKRLFWRSAVLLVALMAVLAIVLYLALGRLIKTGIETAGGMVTRCDVRVERVEISPLRGRLHIANLVVGNPDGFRTPHALAIEEVRVSMVPKSLLIQPLRVHDVVVTGAQITYEVGLGTSNIGTIQDNTDAFRKAVLGDESPSSKKREKAPRGDGARLVSIDHVLVENPRVNLSGTVLGGRSLPIDIDSIEIHDIGRDAPVGADEAGAQILSRVLARALESVHHNREAIVENAKDLGKGILEDPKALKKGLEGLGKGVKKLFGKDP